MNHGTFETAGGHDADNYIRVDITNDATVKIEGANTVEDSAAGVTKVTKNRALYRHAHRQLHPLGRFFFTQAGGTLANSGTFSESGGTFTQSGGADTGNTISLSSSATLADSTGAGSFDLFGADTLSGTIPSGQTVDAIGNPTSNVEVTLGTNVINHGEFASTSRPPRAVASQCSTSPE